MGGTWSQGLKQFALLRSTLKPLLNRNTESNRCNTFVSTTLDTSGGILQNLKWSFEEFVTEVKRPPEAEKFLNLSYLDNQSQASTLSV